MERYPEIVIREADLFAPPRDTLSEPLEHLTACHRRIEQRLDTLVLAGEHISDAPEEARAAISKAIEFMEGSGARHTEDEEESIFPRLTPLVAESDAGFLAELEAQHVQADELFVRLKDAAARLPESAAEYRELAGQLREIYKAHIAAEDSRLVALGRQALSTEQLQQISAEMRARRGMTPCST